MTTTLVTGAAGALGSALVKDLLEHGQRVIAVDRVKADGTGVETHVFDGASADEWRLFSEGLAAIDGAVLVAGGWAGGKPFHESDAAEWERMFRVNLETARHALRAILPNLVARKHGSVVLIGSRAVARPWESAGAAAYAASKAALVALAQVVAAEVLSAGVRVNVVLPSVIDTQANRRAMPDAESADWVEPSSLASVIRFLLSDDSRDISGAALPVYGRA